MTQEALKLAQKALSNRNAPAKTIYEALHAIKKALAQPEFIKHEVENADDWSEWVCPDHKGYLMKCCDCGLVHEAEFRIVRYKSETEREDCDIVDDPNLQAVFRMRRSEQWLPEDTAQRAGGLPMAQPEQDTIQRLSALVRAQQITIDKLEAQPEQEPVALQMDVIVVNLVREGINKHRARELAEHFIKHTTPPQREPKPFFTEANGFPQGFVPKDRHKVEQEPMAMKFKIYKPTVPDPTRQDINNALLPWVYDQDRSSGFDASMWVTPVSTLPPQRKPLTDEQKTRMWQKEHEKESRRAAFEWYLQGVADTEAAHGIKE